MKILASTAFKRDSKWFFKKNRHLKPSVDIALARLAADITDPQLKTHKLKGEMKGSWACSVAYDVRIVFEIVSVDDEDVILLHTIGSHNDVY